MDGDMPSLDSLMGELARVGVLENASEIREGLERQFAVCRVARTIAGWNPETEHQVPVWAERAHITAGRLEVLNNCIEMLEAMPESLPNYTVADVRDVWDLFKAMMEGTEQRLMDLEV